MAAVPPPRDLHAPWGRWFALLDEDKFHARPGLGQVVQRRSTVGVVSDESFPRFEFEFSEACCYYSVHLESLRFRVENNYSADSAESPVTFRRNRRSTSPEYAPNRRNDRPAQVHGAHLAAVTERACGCCFRTHVGISGQVEL